ncbi:MAG TPA: AsmA family protein, partial [Alphaproteobacteria bacterium]|nr:AsmA family protein [Alphaproteobacteria bacterium]
MGLAAVSRKKVFLGAVLLLLIAFFLPPNINAARFKSTLAPALSAALGREVRIGAVHFRLLPRPGFDLHDFKVMDDPAFSPEPLLQCGEVTADVRLRSLWQGRLEIANLRLRNATDQAPPSLNLVYRDGHWNLESLLARAGQASTAPTATKHAEQRLRFPYVAATGGRINVKIGMEKKPYALMDTDFELLLAAEERWHFLLEGRPVRTDMNLGDTGTIKLEGDLSHLRDLPHLVLNLNASWKNAQLGQLSSLVLGQDKGWRGTLALSAQLTGSPNHMQLTTDVTLRNPRRYDINRSNIPPLDVTCLGDYTETSLGFKCNSTLGTGEVVLSGNLAPPIRQNYDISLAARNVPLASMAAILRQVKRTVPDDVTATGDINATFNFRSADGQKEWVGDGATTDFAVRSSAGAAPFQVSPVKFHMGSAETEPGRKQAKTRTSKRKTAAVTSPPDTLTIDPFAVRMSEDAIAQVHGWIDHHGYLLQARGAGAQLESVLELGQTSGFQRRVGPITGKVDFDVQMSGPWAGFAPPVLTGKARVQGVKYAIPGIKDPLRLAAAEVELTEEAFTL